MRKLLVPFLLLSAMALAQQITINGNEHPELIPDEAAASAVFSVHSMFDTPADSTNTEKHHAKVGLSEQDRAAYYAAMQNFHQMAVAKKPLRASSVLGELKATRSVAYRQSGAYSCTQAICLETTQLPGPCTPK